MDARVLQRKNPAEADNARLCRHGRVGSLGHQVQGQRPLARNHRPNQPDGLQHDCLAVFPPDRREIDHRRRIRGDLRRAYALNLALRARIANQLLQFAGKARTIGDDEVVAGERRSLHTRFL